MLKEKTSSPSLTENQKEHEFVRASRFLEDAWGGGTPGLGKKGANNQWGGGGRGGEKRP